MKVALIVPAEPEKAPYIQYYINVFKEKGVEYDVIAWNRSGNNLGLLDHSIIYNKPSPDTLSNMKKICGFRNFKRFVERIIMQKRYDCLVVHTIMLAVFMSPFLIRYYRGNYIWDIRDECAFLKIVRWKFAALLKYSFCNVISSWGFKLWLPDSEYIISHNVGFHWKEKVNMQVPSSFFQHRPLNILTIGQIRHFEGNRILVDELGNKDYFVLHFAGEGMDSLRLQQYCNDRNMKNVTFSGRYLKKDEDNIIQTCDFVNILLPQTLTLQAMANRLYAAILNYKPVIVNEESIQAEYVKRYHLGIIWKQGMSLQESIVKYIKQFDEQEFVNGRSLFFEEISADVSRFETMLSEFIK